MATYTVIFTFDVEGDSPRDAEVEAIRMLRTSPYPLQAYSVARES